MLNQDLRRRARDAGHAVMLGEPVARIAEPLGVAGQIDRFAQRIASGHAGANRGEVENRERHHRSGDD